MHPELTYEPDMAEILRGYGELAALLLDKSEAELVQGGVRLRETLSHLKRVEVALQESESRHAFLLRLGDALRLLIDPLAIQGEASRLLGERLLTDRAYYADIDEAQGYILVERNFVRAGVSSTVGRFSLSDFNWVGPTFRAGGPVVVADTQTSPLIPDADRPAVAAVGVGAFVAAPLIRDGRLVAALFVSDLSPRVWTPEEVELVKETAERTWEAIERARAEEQLREANARKDEFLAMLAHELRNPLAPIRTGLELIRRGGDTVVAVERVRGMMERQVGHMVRLIDDLLDVSRITSGKIVIQRGTNIARESGPQRGGGESCRHGCQTNRIARRAAKGRLRHRCGSDTVRSDPVEPASQRGEIHEQRRLGVHLRNDHAARRAMHCRRCRFRWSIQESGFRRSSCLVCSISSRKERRAPRNLDWALASRSHADWWNFMPDVSTPAVKDMGEVASSSSRCHWRRTKSVPAIERRADEQRLDRRILVVDDNQDAANATAMLIAEMGGDARVAYDGESALAMLQEYQPEVILLDIGMRGLDGYETCQRIRRVLGNGVLLVALTGFGQEQDKEKATRAGFDAHLTKPADEAALTGILACRVSSDT